MYPFAAGDKAFDALRAQRKDDEWYELSISTPGLRRGGRQELVCRINESLPWAICNLRN